MKFVAVAALASLATAQVTKLEITNFSASCIPHSVMCNYSFDVTSIADHAHCAATTQGPDFLPTVGQGVCEGNDYFHWTVANGADSALDLKVANNGVTFCHTIPASDITLDQNGAVVSQRYTGSASFTLEKC